MANNIVAWFSCGATSAVTCKLILEQYPEAEIIYIETGSHHPDNQRFVTDCEKWYGKKIKILQSKYTSVMDVVRRTRFINSPRGAACTTLLKTRVRQQYEYEYPETTHYAWGFEDTKKERNRAERMCNRYPGYIHLFPLIEKRLDKANCLCILEKARIELPQMYKLGYRNNNCIGCVKGGAGYWNKIRVDFPEIFNEMAKIEKEIGHSCMQKYFLDDLPPDAGRNQKEIMPECSIFCAEIGAEDD
jgi:3'-phosphoadenosine 5'-phosphosulfate sulfotransferase (PAPS reductase)/FAD synthetase